MWTFLGEGGGVPFLYYVRVATALCLQLDYCKKKIMNNFAFDNNY